MEQKIIGFHRDAEQHWVADLSCGHKQHVRHDPPFVQRPWVLKEEGRQGYLGTALNCKRCDEVGLVVARAIQKQALKAIQEAFSEAGLAGLCSEGQKDLAVDRLRSLDLSAISEQAILDATTELGTLAAEKSSTSSSDK